MAIYDKEEYKGFENVLEILQKQNANDKKIKLWEKLGRRIVCRCGSDVIRVNQVAVNKIFSNPHIPVSFLEAIDLCSENDAEIVIWQDYSKYFTSIEENMFPEDKDILVHIDTPRINNRILIVVYKEDKNTTIVKFWTPEPFED